MAAVLDSSAVLAIVFEEEGAEIVLAQVAEGAVLGAVNLAEVATKLVDMGYSPEELDTTLSAFATASPVFDRELAMSTGRLRAVTRDAGLSLGDRACLALAMRESAVALTADRAWQKIDTDIQIELIR